MDPTIAAIQSAPATRANLPPNQFDRRNCAGIKFIEVGFLFERPNLPPSELTPPPPSFTLSTANLTSEYSYDRGREFRILTIALESFSVKRKFAVPPNEGFKEEDRQMLVITCPQLQQNSRYLTSLPYDAGIGLAGAIAIPINTSLPASLTFSVGIIDPDPSNTTLYFPNANRLVNLTTIPPVTFGYMSQWLERVDVRFTLRVNYEPNEIPFFGAGGGSLNQRPAVGPMAGSLAAPHHPGAGLSGNPMALDVPGGDDEGDIPMEQLWTMIAQARNHPDTIPGMVTGILNAYEGSPQLPRMVSMLMSTLGSTVASPEMASYFQGHQLHEQLMAKGRGAGTIGAGSTSRSMVDPAFNLYMGRLFRLQVQSLMNGKTHHLPDIFSGMVSEGGAGAREMQHVLDAGGGASNVFLPKSLTTRRMEEGLRFHSAKSQKHRNFLYNISSSLTALRDMSRKGGPIAPQPVPRLAGGAGRGGGAGGGRSGGGGVSGAVGGTVPRLDMPHKLSMDMAKDELMALVNKRFGDLHEQIMKNTTKETELEKIEAKLTQNMDDSKASHESLMREWGYEQDRMKRSLKLAFEQSTILGEESMMRNKLARKWEGKLFGKLQTEWELGEAGARARKRWRETRDEREVDEQIGLMRSTLLEKEGTERDEERVRASAHADFLAALPGLRRAQARDIERAAIDARNERTNQLTADYIGNLQHAIDRVQAGVNLYEAHQTAALQETRHQIQSIKLAMEESDARHGESLQGLGHQLQTMNAQHAIPQAEGQHAAEIQELANLRMKHELSSLELERKKSLEAILGPANLHIGVLQTQLAGTNLETQVANAQIANLKAARELRKTQAEFVAGSGTDPTDPTATPELDWNGMVQSLGPNARTALAAQVLGNKMGMSGAWIEAAMMEPYQREALNANETARLNSMAHDVAKTRAQAELVAASSTPAAAAAATAVPQSTLASVGGTGTDFTHQLHAIHQGIQELRGHHATYMNRMASVEGSVSTLRDHQHQLGHAIARDVSRLDNRISSQSASIEALQRPPTATLAADSAMHLASSMVGPPANPGAGPPTAPNPAHWHPPPGSPAAIAEQALHTMSASSQQAAAAAAASHGWPVSSQPGFGNAAPAHHPHHGHHHHPSAAAAAAPVDDASYTAMS